MPMMPHDPSRNESAPFIPLSRVFREHAGRSWVFITPGGNWGDILIYRGAEHLAKRLGLKTRTLSVEDFAQHEVGPEECIYIHGGGGLNSWCSGTPFQAFKDACSRRCSTVVLGPQTCEAENGNLIERLQNSIEQSKAARIIVLAREWTSLEAFEPLSGYGAEVGVDHDTALHLDVDALLDIAGLSHQPSGRYPLVVVRTDRERKADAANRTLIRGVQVDTAFEAKSFPHWVRMHLYASDIHTDRLHSGIIGALLGKPVTLYQGAYHKNRSLWEFSLKSRGVRWGSGTLAAEDALSCIPARIRDCYKVRSLRKRLWGVPSS